MYVRLKLLRDLFCHRIKPHPTSLISNSPPANKRTQQQDKRSIDLSPLLNTFHRTNRSFVQHCLPSQRYQFCPHKVLFTRYLCTVSQYFDSYRVPDLQKYPRNRDVTVTGYNKDILREIAIAVHMLRLPEDSDYCLDSIKDCVAKKLACTGLPDCTPPPPPPSGNC